MLTDSDYSKSQVEIQFNKIIEKLINKQNYYYYQFLEKKIQIYEIASDSKRDESK